MPNKKLGWNLLLKSISLFISIVNFCLLIIFFITNPQLDLLIVLGLLLIVSVFLTIYFNLYSIFIYDDRITIKSLWTNKIFNFKDVIIEDDNSIRIFNLEYTELVRIACFFDPYSEILKSYNTYIKKYKIKRKNSNSIKYNYYVKNFSIFGFIYSFIVLSLAGILSYQIKLEKVDEYYSLLILVILGFILLPPSVLAILLYKNFEIRLTDSSLIIKNFLGIRKTFSLEDCSAKFYDYTIKLILPSKRIILFYYFLDNGDLLYKIPTKEKNNSNKT